MNKSLIVLTIAVLSVAMSQKLDFPYTLYNNEIPIDVRQQMMNISNSQNCTASSPISQIKYNFTRVQEVKFADFCTDYAQRTCCSNDNLNSLRIQQVYQNQDLSLDCQQALQRLICYDCDGDVGQGMRSGLCPYQCESIYEQCKNDYFIIDQNSQQIKVCSRQDLMCSQLHTIVNNKKTDFCKLLGYEINDNVDYEEWFYSFYADNSESFLATFRPVCWNFLPSSQIFGPAPPSPLDPNRAKRNDTYKNPFDKLNKNYSTLINALYILLAFIIIVAVVFCGYLCLKSKNNIERGRRIGGSQKNHHD